MSDDIVVDFHFLTLSRTTRVLTFLFNMPIVRHLGGWYVTEWLIERDLVKQVLDAYPESDPDIISMDRVSPDEALAEIEFLGDCYEFGEDPFDPDFQLDLFEDDDADFTLTEDDFDDDDEE